MSAPDVTALVFVCNRTRYLAEECRYDPGPKLEPALLAYRDAAAAIGLCRGDLAPEAIEEVLGKHPAVAAAAAFGGVGDSGMEEISVAVVANRPVTDSDLVAWCAKRNMPVTRVFRVDELPKTETGKIHRELLKQRLLSSGIP